jgi:vancomycin resistance protein YoaR
MAQLPREGRVAAGVRVGDIAADGSVDAAELVDRASRGLDRRLVLTRAGRDVLETSLRELGATVPGESARTAIERIARQGDVWQRLAEAHGAKRGWFHVSLPIALPVDGLAARLEQHKLEEDTNPVAARWSFEKDAATDHVAGAILDVYTTAARLVAAASDRAEGPARVEVAVLHVTPAATRDRVAQIDRSSIVSRYETRYGFVGSESGRAQNIARASQGIDGAVLMPGEVFSFNANVGPRSMDNGFAQAGEIYKGEMRIGVGGGTCQVASTLHASAFFGGLDVVQRNPHSRPSAYIPIGLDATVVYPDVDLKLKNPFDFPVVIRARSDKGLLAIELMGKARMAKVELATATVGVKAYGRKIEKVGFLRDKPFVCKQAGRKGVVIEKVRLIRYADGSDKREKTRDVYPPTTEIFLLGPDALESDLPPLPEDDAPAAAATG